MNLLSVNITILLSVLLGIVVLALIYALFYMKLSKPIIRIWVLMCSGFAGGLIISLLFLAVFSLRMLPVLVVFSFVYSALVFLASLHYWKTRKTANGDRSNLK